jgi:hypothetical protein
MKRCRGAQLARNRVPLINDNDVKTAVPATCRARRGCARGREQRIEVVGAIKSDPQVCDMHSELRRRTVNLVPSLRDARCVNVNGSER